MPPADVPHPPLHPSLAPPGSCHRGFTTLNSGSSFHKQLRKMWLIILLLATAGALSTSSVHSPLLTKGCGSEEPCNSLLGAGNARKAEVLTPLEAVLNQDGWGRVRGHPVSLAPGWDGLGVCPTSSPRVSPEEPVSSFSHDNLADDYYCLYWLSFLLSSPPHYLCFLGPLLK